MPATPANITWAYQGYIQRMLQAMTGGFAQAYTSGTQTCTLGTHNWTDYIYHTGNVSAGACDYIGEDDYGILYYHLPSGTGRWTQIHEHWTCNGSTNLPECTGLDYTDRTINIVPNASGQSDTRPKDGLPILAHSGYIIVAALEFDTFIEAIYIKDSTSYTNVATIRSDFGLTDGNTQKIVINLTS